MYKRRLGIYTRRSYRQTTPFTGLLTIIILGMIIGGLFPLVERMMSPRAASRLAAPTATAPAATPVPPRPTLTPLALPTVVKKPDDLSFLVPAASIRTNVIEVFLDGVSWDVSRLGFNAGHLQGTARFGAKGNLVLAGHVEMADGRPGVFARLNKLNTGDTLILSRGRLQRKYVVSAVKTVAPDDLSVLYPTTEDRLTLITCGDYDFWQNVYQERVVVIADRSA
ncbi:MAG: sortase [Chloroflexi bacterium]|nr:sortase [Chloroflexota bacterium]